jgi:hypothetical protein
VPASTDRRSLVLLLLRIILLAGLFVAAVVLGLKWKYDGQPPANNLKQQQQIQLFVSDPNAVVGLTAVFTKASAGISTTEDLYISIIPPKNENVSWALISVDRKIECGGSPASRSYLEVLGVTPRSRPLRAWLCKGGTANGLSDSLASLGQSEPLGAERLKRSDPQAVALTQGSLISSISFPSVSESFVGAIFARLPALDDEPLPQAGIQLRITGSPNPKFVYLLDEAPGLGSPYVVPSNIATHAVMQLNTGRQIPTYRVDQVDPSNGSFLYDNFVWSGTGFIEPTLALSDPNIDATRGNDDFLAGIALAVAAAALIALIQELRLEKRRDTQQVSSNEITAPSPGHPAAHSMPAPETIIDKENSHTAPQPPEKLPDNPVDRPSQD